MVWLDNHLSPALAAWISAQFSVSCSHIRDLGLARAADTEIFLRAKTDARILITKDRDFAELVNRLGAPPAIILLTMGNTSTTALRVTLHDRLRVAFDLITDGEPLVEIGGAS
jgi:predicted nuclease of predicted toxin-antitoxin system